MYITRQNYSKDWILFILKIPKTDKRRMNLENFFMRRNQDIEERFYSDGMFRCHIFNNFHTCLSFHYCNQFIEYVYLNIRNKKQTNSRIWMDGKCEDYIGWWAIR